MSDGRDTTGAGTQDRDADDDLLEEGEAARPEDQMLRGSRGAIPTEETVPVATALEGGASEYQASLWGDAWRQLRRRPLFVVPAILLVVFTLMAVAPGLFTNQDPRACDLVNSVGRPQRGHWFGFDIQGCDYYSRVIYGTRVSLTIGLLVVTVDVVIAMILGCIAGFYGRFWDSIIGRGADIWFALPTTLAGIVFLSVIGERSLLTVALILIILGWPTLMRVMRSQVIAGKEADYVQAARALGAGDWRILRSHILPNGMAPVIVLATIDVGIIVSAEAALTFLGVGLQTPAISWGLMISNAQGRLLTSPHLLLFPGLFLSVFVLCFIVIGDQLRDALDPRLR
jgi:oligopeptide transport system permease protein